MHAQHEITAPQRLLNEKGDIAEPGFAKKLFWIYDRKDVKAKKIRIKEWDYYYIGNQDVGLCLTIADAGFVASHSISLLGFSGEPFQMNDSEIAPFPMGKVGMPSTSEKGDVTAKAGTLTMTFENDGEKRHLFGRYDNFCNTKKALEFDVTLTEIPEESMVIATPFDKPKHFYYNQKINCMRADGWCRFDGKEYLFNRENGSLATLDWGRGVWTYDNTWYWGSLQTRLKDGSTFGWNIGYGFGNTSAASEDMFFYNGKAHKIGRTEFVIPGDKEGEPRYMEEWKFVSDDGRLDCTFRPIIDRYEPFDLKVMCMIPHQVFGYISGKCVLDDGTVIELDNELGFAEKVHNKW